ncbi:oxidoreductase [Rhodoferax lacus]|uniref:Oxidoreductase n=1 Tax=Rhodoferax lacus TaxID=2184758 RepID=A0A3E1REC4_9BURK|nr:SDR family NAD(P)-dependent oxidoreductase [Rhodoferax lacus]RFO97382.1 oxidoreductase [Rhodoferax lacus]
MSGQPGRTLVTGASSGIGLELARQLAQAGVPVLALGRNVERLQALQKAHPLVDTTACDLRDVAALPGLAALWAARYPDLGCVIHCAGVQHNLRLDAVDYGAANVRAEVDINLVAPMVLTQALLPHLLAQQQALVVHISSLLAYVPKSRGAVYSATKAGLHLFGDALRVQLQGSGVRVVEAVMPMVDTPMTAGRGRNKLPAAEAARQIIAGLATHKSRLWIGRACWMPVFLRLAPGLLARAMQQD